MKFKYLGTLSENISEYWKIQEHKNKPILVYNDRKKHVIDNHLKDFGTVEKIEEVFKYLPTIINKPEYVFYNKKTKGLEYYKRIDSDICVAVRVNSGKVLKVKSWYPANKSKLKNRMKKDEDLKLIKEERERTELPS